MAFIGFTSGFAFKSGTRQSLLDCRQNSFPLLYAEGRAESSTFSRLLATKPLKVQVAFECAVADLRTTRRQSRTASRQPFCGCAQVDQPSLTCRSRSGPLRRSAR